MDFNDIQTAWNSYKPENVMLPINLEKLKSANMPIDKVRKNLRFELLMQTTSITAIGFAPMFNGFPVNMFTPFYIVYSVLLAISIYYLGKLFLFYKKLDKTSLSTKENLYETYFDIRLNMELYKTFCFAIFPFLILLIIGLMYFTNPLFSQIFNNEIAQNKLPRLFVAIIISIVSLGLSVELWVRWFYGKYAKQIRKILDELKEV